MLFLMRAGLHGALCDEMGLGKTLQVSTHDCISFLAMYSDVNNSTA